jgi:DNA-binding NarL/FixJ family response regulator
MVRSGLRRILEADFPGVSVGEVSTVGELHDRLERQTWDVLVLDVSMGGDNTLNVLPSVKERHPRLPVVVLSMYGDRQFVIRALRAGASAYVSKEHAPSELLRAIRAALEGRRYVGEELSALLVDHLATGGTGQPHETLSPRELEIFLLLASARSVSEIAAQLDLSVKTVSTHRSRILDKMSMGSNAELMQYAVRLGLVG